MCVCLRERDDVMCACFPCTRFLHTACRSVWSIVTLLKSDLLIEVTEVVFSSVVHTYIVCLLADSIVEYPLPTFCWITWQICPCEGLHSRFLQTIYTHLRYTVIWALSFEKQLCHSVSSHLISPLFFLAPCAWCLCSICTTGPPKHAGVNKRQWLILPSQWRHPNTVLSPSACSQLFA